MITIVICWYNNDVLFEYYSVSSIIKFICFFNGCIWKHIMSFKLLSDKLLLCFQKTITVEF